MQIDRGITWGILTPQSIYITCSELFSDYLNRAKNKDGSNNGDGVTVGTPTGVVDNTNRKNREAALNHIDGQSAATVPTIDWANTMVELLTRGEICFIIQN